MTAGGGYPLSQHYNPQQGQRAQQYAGSSAAAPVYPAPQYAVIHEAPPRPWYKHNAVKIIGAIVAFLIIIQIGAYILSFFFSSFWPSSHHSNLHNDTELVDTETENDSDLS